MLVLETVADFTLYWLSVYEVCIYTYTTIQKFNYIQNMH